MVDTDNLGVSFEEEENAAKPEPQQVIPPVVNQIPPQVSQWGGNLPADQPITGQEINFDPKGNPTFG